LYLCVGDGGAIFADYESSVAISSSTFHNNTAPQNGGAIMCNTICSFAESTVFSWNYAAVFGILPTTFFAILSLSHSYKYQVEQYSQMQPLQFKPPCLILTVHILVGVSMD
jgi:predicted outer membrane repeat protein